MLWFPRVSSKVWDFSSCTRRQRSIAEISQRSGRSSSGAQLAPTATMENSKLRPNWAQLGRNGSSYFSIHVGLWQKFRWTLRIVTSCHALRQDSRDVVQTSGDCDRKTRTLPAWLKSTVNSEKPQIIWHFSGIEMGGTAREMGRKTREIGGTPRITIFHDLFIGLILYLFWKVLTNLAVPFYQLRSFISLRDLPYKRNIPYVSFGLGRTCFGLRKFVGCVFPCHGLTRASLRCCPFLGNLTKLQTVAGFSWLHVVKKSHVWEIQVWSTGHWTSERKSSLQTLTPCNIYYHWSTTEVYPVASSIVFIRCILTAYLEHPQAGIWAWMCLDLFCCLTMEISPALRFSPGGVFYNFCSRWHVKPEWTISPELTLRLKYSPSPEKATIWVQPQISYTIY